MKRFLPSFLVIIALILTGCGSLKGVTFAAPETAPELTLTHTDGTPFRLSEQRGKVMVIFYGFTTCPDICPTTLGELASAYKQLSPSDAEQVTVAMITVDPERDTPQRMADYVTRFNPAFIGLVGTPEEIQSAMKPYGVYAEKRDLTNSALGYTVDHSPYVYVIDKAGRWREFFTMDNKPEDIANDLKILARE